MEKLFKTLCWILLSSHLKIINVKIYGRICTENLNIRMLSDPLCCCVLAMMCWRVCVNTAIACECLLDIFVVYNVCTSIMAYKVLVLNQCPDEGPWFRPEYCCSLKVDQRWKLKQTKLLTCEYGKPCAYSWRTGQYKIWSMIILHATRCISSDWWNNSMRQEARSGSRRASARTPSWTRACEGSTRRSWWSARVGRWGGRSGGAAWVARTRPPRRTRWTRWAHTRRARTAGTPRTRTPTWWWSPRAPPTRTSTTRAALRATSCSRMMRQSFLQYVVLCTHSSLEASLCSKNTWPVIIGLHSSE